MDWFSLRKETTSFNNVRFGPSPATAAGLGRGEVESLLAVERAPGASPSLAVATICVTVLLCNVSVAAIRLFVGPGMDHRGVPASCAGWLVVLAARDVIGSEEGGARKLGNIQRVVVRCSVLHHGALSSGGWREMRKDEERGRRMRNRTKHRNTPTSFEDHGHTT